LIELDHSLERYDEFAARLSVHLLICGLEFSQQAAERSNLRRTLPIAKEPQHSK